MTFLSVDSWIIGDVENCLELSHCFEMTLDLAWGTATLYEEIALLKHICELEFQAAAAASNHIL